MLTVSKNSTPQASSKSYKCNKFLKLDRSSQIQLKQIDDEFAVDFPVRRKCSQRRVWARSTAI